MLLLAHRHGFVRSVEKKEQLAGYDSSTSPSQSSNRVITAADETEQEFRAPKKDNGMIDAIKVNAYLGGIIPFLD